PADSKSERCALHFAPGNAAGLSNSVHDIPTDHTVYRITRGCGIARAADPRSAPHVRSALSRTLRARCAGGSAAYHGSEHLFRARPCNRHLLVSPGNTGVDGPYGSGWRDLARRPICMTQL